MENIRLKRIYEFESIDEEFNISSLLGSLGVGSANTIKSYIVDALMTSLGMDKDSFLGKIINNAVQKMDFLHLTKYFTGGKESIGEWADIIVNGIVGALEDEISDSLFKGAFGTDVNNPIYKILKNTFKTAVNEEIFKNTIKDGVIEILGGTNSNEPLNIKDVFSKIKDLNK